MKATNNEIETLAKTLWGEARGEGLAGMIAVGWTIRNRVEMDLHNDGKDDWWGEGWEGVCKRPWQYSCWNKNDPNYPYLSGVKKIPATQFALALEAANAVSVGTIDPTLGATHYYSTSMKTAPNWAASGKKTVKIGRHIFYKDVK